VGGDPTYGGALDNGYEQIVWSYAGGDSEATNFTVTFFGAGLTLSPDMTSTPQPGLRPPTQKEYNACMQNAASTRDNATLNAREEQAAGGLLTLAGTAVAYYSLPALGEAFFNEGAVGVFDFAHAGGLAYIGAVGPFGAGIAIFAKGTQDVANASDQYYANTIHCAAAVPSKP
jgi:hypothetical protein